MPKLFLDDVRKPPDDSWTWCKSVEEALKFVRENECEEWALDHDLGGQLAHYGKGPYDFGALTGQNFIIAAYQEQPSINNHVLPPLISIHSTNDAGTAAMVSHLHRWASFTNQDIEIIVRPMRGRLMDKTPYYDPEIRK